MFRINYIEPLVMLITLIRWFFLAVLTGAIVGTGTSLFLQGLIISSDKTAHLPLWFQMILLPFGGLLNGIILYYGYRKASKTNYDSVIAAVHENNGILPVVGACITAYIVIGHRSVYPEQLVAYPKSLWVHLVPEIALGKEKIHISYGLLRRIKRWQQHHHLPWRHDQHKGPKKHDWLP